MEEHQYPGRIQVVARLDVAFGEMYFEIRASKRRDIKNKCLYDALSTFGLELDAARRIVEDFAKVVNGEKYYHVDFNDYR